MGENLYDLQPFDGNPLGSHMSWHMVSLENAGGIRGCADRTRSAVKHGTVRLGTTLVAPSLHAPLKSFTLGDPGHLDPIPFLKEFDRQGLANGRILWG